MTPAFVERFWSKVSKGDGCWLWTGYKNPGGYGTFTRRFLFNRNERLAHRISYILARGQAIPSELTLDHLCRVRECVNPAHLEVVTLRENILRGMAPGAQQARQVVCRKGHPFDTENTYRDPKGHRVCRACRRVIDARRRPAKGRFKNYCCQGHPLAEPNLYIDRSGERHCRECRRAADRRRFRGLAASARG